MNDRAPDLVLEHVTIARGGRPVVTDVSLKAPAGEVTVLLGGNGAGKTTLLEGISGVVPLVGGKVLLGDRPIQRLSPRNRSRAGLAHVQEGRAVFGSLTVQENLLVAGGADEIEQAYQLFPELLERRDIRASSLSGGQQQMLVMARALAQRPSVLMIDELSLGLAPIIVSRLLEAVRDLSHEGIAVLLVEQYAHLALEFGTSAYLLQRGRIAHHGSCQDILLEPELLRDVYLRT